MLDKIKPHLTPRNIMIAIAVIGLVAVLATGGINAPAGFGNG